MIWTRLYDPGRTPSHWTDIVASHQYVVFICDARNRAPRDAEGRPFCTDEGTPVSPCAALCEDASEAINFARQIVARHPDVCCEIYDSEGKSKPPRDVIYDPTVRNRYVGPVHARRLALLGAAFACTGTTLVVIDVRHDLTWMWGYILGLKCLIMGGIFLSRGFLEWRECATNKIQD